MSIKPPKNILLTGPPGVGKTTLVKKICTALKGNNRNTYGFYTEEFRNESNNRSGFDVVTIDGQRKELSRTIEYLKPTDTKRYKVGQYYVFVNSFEQVVLPLFTKPTGEVLILDEIGKMELLSSNFQNVVKVAFEKSDVPILATIPIHRNRIPWIETLVQNPNNKLITVDRNNRNKLVDEIVEHFM